MQQSLKLIQEDDNLILEVNGQYVRSWNYDEYGSTVQTEVSRVVTEISRLTGIPYEFEER